jgi:GTP cyclohydrolase I
MYKKTSNNKFFLGICYFACKILTMEYSLNNSNGNYQKVEKYDAKTTEELSNHYQSIIKLLGEDAQREGLEKTPLRVAKAMQFLLQGYEINPEEILKSAMFSEEYRQMVVVKDIELFSMCEHHMLPFIGKAHVAYIPNGKITGLSKIARVVEAFSRRLQVQERLTTQIKDCIQTTLEPLGVAVVIEAQHLCMQMRGVQKQHSVTTTSDFTGAFNRVATREEFLRIISSNLH